MSDGVSLLTDRRRILDAIKENIEDKKNFSLEYIKYKKQYKQALTNETVKLIMYGGKAGNGRQLPPLPPSTAKDVSKGMQVVVDIEFEMNTNQILADVAQQNIYLLKDELNAVESEITAERKGQ